MAKIEFKIQSFLVVDNLYLVNGKLISGEIYGEGRNINYFLCVETGGKWKMAAIGFPPLDVEVNEFRSFGIEHVDGNKDLKEGFTLVAK